MEKREKPNAFFEKATFRAELRNFLLDHLIYDRTYARLSAMR